MKLRCQRDKAHKVFTRVVVVQGPTRALLDEHGDVLQYEDCGTFRQIKSTSDVRCAVDGTKPVISITD